MKFTRTAIEGMWLLDLSPIGDERGFFARTYCEQEFSEHGIDTRWVQGNMSFSADAGIIRGLHFQVDSAPEAKLVRCVRGALFDVVVDVRRDSPSYMKHVGVELTEDNRTAVYVPELCAHGFQILRENSEVNYLVSGAYSPDAERGYRYDDPAFGIDWPLPAVGLSAKDESWEKFPG